MSMKPIQSQGKLRQYPDWEEEWDDEEMSYNEDNCEEDFLFQNDLVITSIEKKSLYELLGEMECIPRCSMELFKNIIDKLSHWEFWNCMTATDGTTYISSFCGEITEEELPF